MANFDINGRQLNYDGRVKFPGNFVQSGSSSLNGTNAYIDIPDNSVIDITGTHSFSVWMKATTMVASKALFFKNSSAYYVWAYSSGFLKWATVGLSTVELVVPTPINNYADTWLHVMCIYDATAGTKTVYFNNSQVAQATGLTGTIATNNDSLQLGAFGGSFLFDGELFDFRIYNGKALSLAERTAIYEDPFNAPAADAWYPLAEMNGAKAYDISGNGNHGDWNGTTDYARQDFYNHNICKGCDIYKLDSDPTDITDYLYIPWTEAGTPAATSATGYTKIQGNKGWFHNGAETLIKFDPCPENLIFNKNAIVGNSDGLPEIWLATIQSGDWYDVAFGTNYEWMWSYHELNEDYIALHANPNWTGASLSSVTKRFFTCGKDIVVDGTTKETLEGYVHNILNYESDRNDSEVTKINKFCTNQNKKIS